MSQYEVEITATFSTPQVAGKFAAEFERETGNAPDRDGRVVICLLHNHGTESVVRGMKRRTAK